MTRQSEFEQAHLFSLADIPTKKDYPQPGPRENPNFEQPDEGTIGKYLYHHTDPRHRASIRRQGLLVKDPLRRSARGIETRETAPHGVYLGPAFAGIGTSRYPRDVWAVDTNKIRVEQDPSDYSNYWGFHYSSESIPPEAMKLIHKGQRKRKS